MILRVRIAVVHTPLPIIALINLTDWKLSKVKSSACSFVKKRMCNIENARTRL
ncbi:hypothetical protein JG687_00016595 [Phytophthora cactorum]|uniref:Uncharacterized protein n=1 Tax=Phytophthora cactorum TaxID=29920 RepID=A0A8T1TSU1_9STRA|nr:hypothetical protein JG687_00016595 [Phytophthora cactorum]